MRSLEVVGWGVAAVVVSAWLALVEVFWLPLRVAGVPLPLSVVGAAVGNVLLVTAAHRLSGSRVVGALPAVVWLVVAVASMVRRPEGDIVMAGGGTTGTVGLAFLLVGVVAASAAAGRVLATPVPGRAGSGSGGAR